MTSTPTIPAEISLIQVRGDATPDAETIASVKQFGILQPPTVTWDEAQGKHVIVIGHRRVGAAIAAGLTEIPAILRPDALADDAIKTEQQLVENERRKSLTAADVARGYQRLQLFGKTPAEIAAETGERPERVRAGLKIHASKAVTKLVDEDPSIDFEQAAIIAEFDDHPKLQQKLIETATTNPANFQRDVENQRTQREVDSRIAKLKALLEETGVPLIEVSPYSDEWFRGKDGKGRAIDRLGIALADHVGCAGHAAIIHRAQSHYLNQQPSEWILYVCTDWEDNDHAGAAAAPEKSAEQLERDAERARIDAERAAKRQLIDANTRARRAWLHGYLSTGRLRPTAAHFDLMAEALAEQLSAQDSPPANITLELLAGEPVERRYWHQPNSNDDALAAVIDDPATPNLRVIVAHAIATFEDALDAPRSVKYFDALAAWGYALTDTDREHLENAKHNAAEESEEAEAGEAEDGDE